MPDDNPNDDLDLKRLNDELRDAFAAALPDEFTDNPPHAVKATHVEVDATAWRFLRTEVVRCHVPLSEVVGQLIRNAVTDGVPVERAVEDVSRRATEGRRATAFTRLYGVSDEIWTEFKAEASEAGVTVARAVGMLAEFAAEEVRRQLAEAEPSRDHPARPRDRRRFDGRGR